VSDPGLVRAVGLAVPVLVVVVLCALRPPSPRELAAVITATGWSFVLLWPLNLAAPGLGWWEFGADGAAWRGAPVDLVLAWALLWGAVPALILRTVRRRTGGLRAGHLLVLGAGLVWLDLAVMPLGGPVVVLRPAWLVGEAVAAVAVLVPALLLTRWTLGRTRVGARAWAQAVWAGGLVLALPVAVLAPSPPWPAPVTSAGIQLVLVLCLPGLAAMRELAVVGRGTPLPYDPPSRLVASGPYAYVRNPMQATVVAAFLGLAFTFAAPQLAIGAVAAVVYGAGLAQWHEGQELAHRYGDGWLRYRGSVRAWVPRWRPATTIPRAVLYVAADCDICTGVGGWFAARDTTGLVLRPAAEHRDVLYRVRYESAGVRADGVAAIARALGHTNLGWAAVGWALDLPVVRQFTQLCADAFGAGPRPSRPRPAGSPQESSLRDGVGRRRPALRPRHP